MRPHLRRILFETQRDPLPLAGNVITGSSDISNVAWGNYGPNFLTVTTNNMLAPDGSMNADLGVPTANNDLHDLSQTNLTTTGGTWILRGRFRMAGYSSVLIQIANDAVYTKYTGAYFDLAGGRVLTTATGVTYVSRPRLRRLANHWMLCEIAVDNVDANSTHRAEVYWVRGGTDVSYAGDTVSGIHAWGIEFAPAA
jgi:hypothetical protein